MSVQHTPLTWLLNSMIDHVHAVETGDAATAHDSFDQMVALVMGDPELVNDPFWDSFTSKAHQVLDLVSVVAKIKSEAA